MLTRQQAVANILADTKYCANDKGQAYAPTNIALAKYWGKRNEQLNLPVTSSLSISLDKYGTDTTICIADTAEDKIIFNNKPMDKNTQLSLRITNFLNLLRPKNTYFEVKTNSNVPIAAGLASSASGFAALTKAVDELFVWNLSELKLSQLARFGSGSAARSMWHGFVKWQAGKATDGSDCYAAPFEHIWPELRIGLCLLDTSTKTISSREAMRASVSSCPFYPAWPTVVEHALDNIERAIIDKDFWTLGAASEQNSLAMHAIMQATIPAVVYSLPETLACMQKIWQARAQGLAVFFTQDAGPNLKLIFQAKDTENVKKLFAQMKVVAPFASSEVIACSYE